MAPTVILAIFTLNITSENHECYVHTQLPKFRKKSLNPRCHLMHFPYCSLVIMLRALVPVMLRFKRDPFQCGLVVLCER